MGAGEAIAIGFAAGSAGTLMITLLMLRRAYKKRMAAAAKALGVVREMGEQLGKEGRLSGALEVGHTMAIGPQALDALLEIKRRSQA